MRTCQASHCRRSPSHTWRGSSKVHESCSVSILDGDNVVYVARVPTKRIMTVAISVGTRFPAYATSMGRILLAHQDPAWLTDYLERSNFKKLTPHTTTDPEDLAKILAQVRAQGYCLVDQELEEGLRSIAVPITNGAARVIAAMNVSAHISRGSAAAIRQELLPPLQQAAADVHADLAAQ